MAERSWRVLALVALAAAAAAAAGGEDPARDLTVRLRAAIEPEFRQRTGLGFRSFSCLAVRPPGPGDFLDCDAVDDEGDVLRYTLKVDAAGEAEVVLVSQAASGLGQREKEALEPPCRAFLKAYDAADWKAAHAVLHPALRESVTLEQARTRLAPVRKALGAVRSAELRSYSRRLPDEHELEYVLASERGRGLARFRVHPQEKGSRLTAFLVTAEPGSPLQAAMLQPELRALVGKLLGRPVERLEAPLHRLARRGDVAPGSATLAGGRQVSVLFEQTGRPDDFDPIDFTAHVLEATFLVEHFLAGRGDAVASVSCPAAVLEDGAGQTCRAELAGRQRLDVTIARDGVRHRVTEVKPAR